MMLDEAGDRLRARSAYEAALGIAQQLSDDRPGDPALRLQIPVVRQKLIGVLRDSGDLDGALEASSASVADAGHVAALDPDNEVAHRQLGMAT